MYTFSVNTAKRQQFWSRFCLKTCCLFQKVPPQSVPNNQKPKKWWKNSFQNIFGRYLLLTNTISSGVLMALGDLIQQEIEFVNYGNHKKSFDWKRNSTDKYISTEYLGISENFWTSRIAAACMTYNTPLCYSQSTASGDTGPDEESSSMNFPRRDSVPTLNMGIVGTLQGSLAHFFYQILDRYFPGVQITTIMKKILIDQTIASPLFILLFFGGMNYLGNADFEQSKAELKEKFWVVYAVDCSVWTPAQFFNFYCLSSKYRVIYINALTTCYNIFLSFIKHVESFK